MDATNSNETHDCTYTYGADGLRRSQAVMNEITGGGVTLNGHGGQTNDLDDAGGEDTPNFGDTTNYAYDGTMLVREMKTVNGVLTPTATYF